MTQEYIITDQKGNARVSFNNTGTGGTAKVVQENSYYGFGMVMPGSAVTGGNNKQLYNGRSEWQNDYSNLPDYYQTFYRNYDAALGRFVGIDPEAESAESMTGYQYAGNNPIMFNDPLGNMKKAPSDDPMSYNLPQGGSGGSWGMWGLSNDDVTGFSYDAEASAGVAIPNYADDSGFASGADALNAIDKLWADARGGHADGTGIHFFQSDQMEVKYAFALLQSFGLVGSPYLPGSAISLADAYDNYNKDPNSKGSQLYLTSQLDPTYNKPIGGGLSWLSTPDGNNNSAYGSLNEVSVTDGKSFFDKALEAFDKAGTYTEAIAYAGSKSGLEFAGENTLRAVGNIVGLVVIGDDFYKSYQAARAGHYGQAGWQALKGVGTGAFMYFGGTEYQGVKLLWNMGTMLIDESSGH